MQQIQTGESGMQKILPAAILAATALAGHAMAMDVKLYGTVDKALMGYNDGQNSDVTVVDNNNETTRFGLGGEQKLDNGLTASFLFENQMSSNNSAGLTQNTAAGASSTPANTTVNLQERIARVGLAGNWGAMFLGQQDVASDDAYSHDLAAASSVLNANVASFGGALVFQNAAGANLSVGGTDLTPNLFALGNNGDTATADALRYNSPIWNGLNGSASISQGGNVDATIRYTRDYADVSVDSALGYTRVNNQATAASNGLKSSLNGSVSAKLKNGLGATVAYTSQQLDNKTAGVEDPSGIYGKVGYAWGAYGVAAEYGQFKNPVAVSTDTEMDVYGVGAEWAMADGITVGALYRNFTPKVSGVSGEQDIDLYALSMRVKF
jgi:predicted porin